jgi:hypothetical protein
VSGFGGDGRAGAEGRINLHHTFLSDASVARDGHIDLKSTPYYCGLEFEVFRYLDKWKEFYNFCR